MAHGEEVAVDGEELLRMVKRMQMRLLRRMQSTAVSAARGL